MWILAPLEPAGETHFLLPGRDHVVGRKNCDVLLANDQSISRVHALLSATEQTLSVKDTSKYGTVVNGQRLAEDRAVSLEPGDLLTFGVFQAKFRVERQNAVVCSSCLDQEAKARLSRDLQAVGGRLVNAWSHDCTHLVMTSVKVTIKTISALLCCCPIVKPEFFSEFSRAVQQKTPPPTAQSFCPEVDEPSLDKEEVKLGQVLQRRQLFEGTTFVFLSAKQLKRLSAAVGFGGGRSELLEEGLLPRDLLESPQSCVVDVASGGPGNALTSSAAEWTSSVRSIVQRRGLRVISESEIGLAAVYASRDQYCNPSARLPRPGLLGASLSQSTAVDETVLPAATQNITAYVVNTEETPRFNLQEVPGFFTVGETQETPETRQNLDSGGPVAARPSAQKISTQSVVPESVSSSLGLSESMESTCQKLETRPKGGISSPLKSPRFWPQTSGGVKTFPQRASPQKHRSSPQTSPQKQATLTSFFQPVPKKRPLEDELSAQMSQPKHLAMDSVGVKEPADVGSRQSRGPSASPAPDGFLGRSEVPSDQVLRSGRTEPQSRKRKEMEDLGDLEELESLMSEDMDFCEPAAGPSGSDPPEAPSSSKRPRLGLGEPGAKPQPEARRSFSPKPQLQVSSISMEQLGPEGAAPSAGRTCSPPPRACRAPSTEVSAGAGKRGDLPRSFTIKQEEEEYKVDEDLPKKLVLVEFRSLTVGASPRTKPQLAKTNCSTKNYKAFSKAWVPGSSGSVHVVRGADLLVHLRGKNSDLDEWLKDTAEEERQTRLEESQGDELFRYNPTKVRRRR